MGVTRGQIWVYTVGSRAFRMLIVSNDEHNDFEELLPWGLAVERAGAESVLSVRLAAGDPLAGAFVMIPKVYRLDRTALRENLGFVGNDTMNAVEYGLREFLVLP